MLNNTLRGKATTKVTAKGLFLLLAPVVSYWYFEHSLINNFSRMDFNSINLVFALFWSPLFFSIPALLLQSARDSYQPQIIGIFHTFKRGISLIPALIKRKDSVSLEMSMSLIGYGVMLLMILI